MDKQANIFLSTLKFHSGITKKGSIHRWDIAKLKKHQYSFLCCAKPFQIEL